MLLSSEVLTGAIGNRVVILDPTTLLVADDGELDVTIARHASVEMEGTAKSPPPASTVYLNLWQTNMTGLKIDRFIRWQWRARMQWSSQTSVIPSAMNLTKLAESMAAATVDTIKRAIQGPLVHGRMAALEAWIAALEAKPAR